MLSSSDQRVHKAVATIMKEEITRSRKWIYVNVSENGPISIENFVLQLYEYRDPVHKIKHSHICIYCGMVFTHMHQFSYIHDQACDKCAKVQKDRYYGFDD